MLSIKQADLNLSPISFQITDTTFIKKLVLLTSLLLIGFYFILNGHWFIQSLGIAIIGIMFAHAIELQHQCLHNTAFQNRKLNYIVGFILGLPMFVSFTDYQVQHMHHHRFLGTPKDQEFFVYDANFLANVLNFKRYLSLLNKFILVFSKQAINQNAKDKKVD